MELYIEGYRIELGDVAIRQTLQINDLAEVKNRQTNFTNRFKIPATPWNIERMDFLGISGNNSKKPSQKLAAKLVDGNIELVSDGYAVITSFDGQYYDCVVYSGNISLSKALKGKKLNELDYSTLNHEASIDNFINSLNNTSGYIHALADFGKMDSEAFEIDFNPGALFVSTLWDMIFTQSGLSYSGSIFQNPKFLNHVVTPIRGTVGLQIVISETTEMGYNICDLISFEKDDLDENGYTFNQDFTFSGSATDITNNEDSLTFNFTGICKLHVVYDLAVYGGIHQESIKLLLNGNIVDIVYDTITKDYNLFVNSGDILTMNFDVYAHSESGTTTLSIEVSAGITFNHTSSSGPVIDYSAIMPNQSQLDFIKDIMQRFGLLFRQRRNSQHYEFIEIEEMLNDKANAEDWSEIYISHTESYSVGNYAKENKAIYQYEDKTEPFADGIIALNNDNIPSSKTLFSSIFKATSVKEKINGINVYGMVLWESDKDDSFRIFEITRHDANIRIKLTNLSNIITLTSGIPFLDFEPCHYQNYINMFYSAFSSMLEKNIKIKMLSYIDAIDIYNIDFFKLKYIKQIGKYFYLNKIKDFASGKNTNVELIEI